ncbi:uncharacterized protein LOC128715281 [Anopheles marshallii]|uniref:uncharacterized protein LOC128715281 n=1 Tax=Anopheles marshallii TaxID=1521116 RepID=UPI00237C15A5|nr:uncharacterized protein LOC128715281 [Anopheles marshallii]
MGELQQFEEFVSQIAKPERTIKCIPDGIGFALFATICDLPGAPDDAKQRLQSPVSQLRQATLSVEEQIKNTAIIVRILLDQSTSFVTLEQYSWFVRMTIAAKLLKPLPMKVATLVRKLDDALGSIDLVECNHSPRVVETLVRSLIEDIPLDGGNLLHTITMLATANCPVLYYTAVVLIFIGLDAITHSGKPTKSYHLQGASKFLDQLEICNLQYLQQQRTNLQTIYQLLKLLSLYQNLVIMRHVGKSLEDLAQDHKDFADFFHVTNVQIKTFRNWLDNASAIVQPFGKDQENDYLFLADLLQVDMIPLFYDLSPDDDIV